MLFVFLFIFFFSAFIGIDVNGLSCFECNSLFDQKCEHIKKDDKFRSMLYTPCSPEHIYDSSNITGYIKDKKLLCRKIEQKIRVRNNMKIIKRSCGWQLQKKNDSHYHDYDHCYTVRNEDHEEIVCQCFEDGCNNSIVKHANFYFIFIVSSSLLIFSMS